MNSFKLILRLLGLSFLIWLTTNIIGSAALVVYMSQDDFQYAELFALVLFMSLMISSPVILLMSGNLYLLTLIKKKKLRILYVCLSTLLICAVLLITLLGGNVLLPVNDPDIWFLFLPYIIAAVAMVFLFARRMIFFSQEMYAH